MKANRKYKVSCSGSGWGVWSQDGEKICACRSRVHALETLYDLMGWSKPLKWY